jgi:uncharacterized SAM-binding protein YcdF (DUF218 family)
MRKLLAILAAAIVTAAILYALLLAYIRTQASKDTRTKSDVILVLGGKAYSGESCYGPICKNFVPKRRYNSCLVARVNHAVSLYRSGLAPKILMSGGVDKEDNANESEVMKKIAVEAGVPEQDIFREDKSTSTYENIAFSKRVMDKAGLRSAVIVTDPYHNARAGLVALKQGLDYSISAATELSNCSHPDDYFVREPLAIIGYKLLNRL